MASTDYDFNLTRTEIIERAFRIIGVLTLGESLDDNESAQGITALNSLVKQWQTRNVWLWTLSLETISVNGASASVGLDPSIIGIEKAFYTQNSQDIQMEVISYRRYVEITRKSTTSGTTPSVVALGHEKQNPTLYVWPATSSATDIKVLAIIRLQDMNTNSGNADIPQRFLDALTYGLASNLADEYGRPLNERQALEEKYERLFAFAKRSDKERETRTVVVSAYPKR